MRQRDELGLRRLTLTVTTFFFLAGLVGTYVVRFLPHDPLGLRLSLTIYFVLVSLASVIGFVGAVQRNATLLTLFATHLLVDSILYFIPRLLLLKFSFSVPSSICSNSKYPPESTSPLRDSSLLRNATVNIEDKIKQLSSPAWSEGSCRVWMWGLESAFIILVLILAVAEALLAIRLWGYAAWLGRKRAFERLESSLC